MTTTSNTTNLPPLLDPPPPVEELYAISGVHTVNQEPFDIFRPCHFASLDLLCQRLRHVIADIEHEKQENDIELEKCEQKINEAIEIRSGNDLPDRLRQHYLLVTSIKDSATSCLGSLLVAWRQICRVSDPILIERHFDPATQQWGAYPMDESLQPGLFTDEYMTRELLTTLVNRIEQLCPESFKWQVRPFDSSLSTSSSLSKKNTNKNTNIVSTNKRISIPRETLTSSISHAIDVNRQQWKFYESHKNLAKNPQVLTGLQTQLRERQNRKQNAESWISWYSVFLELMLQSDNGICNVTWRMIKAMGLYVYGCNMQDVDADQQAALRYTWEKHTRLFCKHQEIIKHQLSYLATPLHAVFPLADHIATYEHLWNSFTYDLVQYAQSLSVENNLYTEMNPYPLMINTYRYQTPDLEALPAPVPDYDPAFHTPPPPSRTSSSQHGSSRQRRSVGQKRSASSTPRLQRQHQEQQLQQDHQDQQHKQKKRRGRPPKTSAALVPAIEAASTAPGQSPYTVCLSMLKRVTKDCMKGIFLDERIKDVENDDHHRSTFDQSVKPLIVATRDNILKTKDPEGPLAVLKDCVASALTLPYFVGDNLAASVKKEVFLDNITNQLEFTWLQYVGCGIRHMAKKFKLPSKPPEAVRVMGESLTRTKNLFKSMQQQNETTTTLDPSLLSKIKEVVDELMFKYLQVKVDATIKKKTSRQG
eukprot:GILJ01022709.1.p1 GENE.GILJ01022709.1~~GILJ01022709.1.p1  ORF type:complete len:704 (-),score=95.08 GILJ01022709.1:28-2139(-)